MFDRVSPFVQRNLDNAQYAQPRGSQYEGPRFDSDLGDNKYEDSYEAHQESVTAFVETEAEKRFAWGDR